MPSVKLGRRYPSPRRRIPLAGPARGPRTNSWAEGVPVSKRIHEWLTALSAVGILFVVSPRAAAGNAFGGESNTHVGDGGHDAWMIGQSQDVGYKYASVAF